MNLPSIKIARFVLVPFLMVTLGACGGSPDTASESQQSTAPQASESASQEGEAASQAAPEEKLNLNTATEEDFRSIPGVGDNMVHEFQEYRPYVSIQQFRREIGKYVDEEQVASYEEYVYVPIDPNESDVNTLQQLPGVDASVAEELAANRPYDSNQAFLDALASHVTESQLSTAEAYLVKS